MINKIIAFSIRNKLIVGLLTLALIAAGIRSMTRVPLDAVPDITNNQVQVITQAPNLGTEDIEQFVTYPVEVSMANLPGVTEIRSVSRFGLSVVTIVFEDDMDTYLPRQLVSEKLTEVREKIPPGFGQPFMGPISTGLGEIYQYTLAVDSAYGKQYSLTELRTIQDWIIRRQMAMVPGVVEVNAFGGNTRQYEVAVNPDQLKAIGLTISEVFSALEKNNQNTGGAYIEKDHYANFIRGEGLARSTDDLRSIVVSNQNGIPVTIGDIAEVRTGKAVRYGALTKDGKGEAVGGMVLMLKGANSNNVISAVKERMDEIRKSLPEGVRIVPFLDRSKLISETTGTVSQNLLEGALIVIFVLVFLLGNWRGGLIVASTIPLSLLFAFILMDLFGVWANLMSLGAIDFGIIVDGAVIIVEGTVFLLHERVLKNRKISADARDEIAGKASRNMMNSAFFGQLIILLVFVPILALEGVEGKMFQPMAFTFMFAMIGVMLLCLTYVPMMSAWFLRAGNSKPSAGDRFVSWLERRYEPLLAGALKRGKWILGSSVLLLVVSGFLFSRLGGEFIPQLDEGDIAFHAILKPGSSLSESVATTTRVEKLIKARFPEVEHVISRIGVADVPTDPMPMDIADCFVLLKPQSEWVNARSKEELVEQIRKTVYAVPGVNFEFTQPIEMRFNELLTGVREDVAVKLFGEDLQVLAEKAARMGEIIATVPGVADMKVEATDGLPQITVRYQRRKLAQYGLTIDELNTIIRTAFAGGKAGVIFEGEKRFDLVVRLEEDFRQNIDNLRNIYVSLPGGTQIPLREVAEISYQPGPMQISRDNTNRRIYVGVNVEGRDVASLVEEIRDKLDAQLDLPPGYYIRYGGAFENFERASKRLQFVVPVALALIFLLIFLALRSFRQALMIYMAIPLAAIGGILFLWLRGMPFSISAGVGFIVLFGVAVLNGLVLVSSWNELKAEGTTDLKQRIRLGARRRIRPILLTALTDVLGFLPMAVSRSAGAEVQQPLATVVIGGMITATLLTLFVLPVLYYLVENRSKTPRMRSFPSFIILLPVLFLFSGKLQAQNSVRVIRSLEEALQTGLSNNGSLQASRQEITILETEQKASFNPGKTSFGGQYGQFNSFTNDLYLSVNQQFDFPLLYTRQRTLSEMQTVGSQLDVSRAENELRRQIRQAWYKLAYLREKRDLLLYQDTLMNRFLRASEVRYASEATNYLEQVTAETRVMEIRNELQKLESDVLICEKQLHVFLNVPEELAFDPVMPEFSGGLFPSDTSGISENPVLLRAQQEISLARAQQSVESARLLPGVSVGYFTQSMIGAPTASGTPADASDRYSGVQFGLSVPLFFGSYKADIRAAGLREEQARIRADYYAQLLYSQYEQQLQEVLKQRNSLEYYRSNALPRADLLIENAHKRYTQGEIDYVEYLQSLTQVSELRFNYLETQNLYNQSMADLEFLLGR